MERSNSKRKFTKSKKKSKCKKYLGKKISINMKEFKKGLFKSRKQAIAVSYSQTLKKHPRCKKILSIY